MSKTKSIYIKFNSYVKTSLKFTRINYLKKQYQQPLNLSYHDIYSSIDNFTEEILDKIFIKSLLKQAQINKYDYFIIYNYYYLNNTDKCIGGKLGITKQAVHNRRKTCLNKLKTFAFNTV